jgi:carbamate kinase
LKVVAALGGNALLKRGEKPDAGIQKQNADQAAQALAVLANQGHSLIITHGNGPQVGLLALQEPAPGAGSADPLDVLDAETEGLIGYFIELALRNHLPGKEIATVLTQVEVDGGDPAFRSPAKPIGPQYDEQMARELERSRQWRMVRDGRHWRRAVASPEPKRILEQNAIRVLADSGAIVICAGGGGIPVSRSPSGEFRGIEAVIDKDLCSALLAGGLGADALLLLTDVDAVYLDWRQPGEHAIRSTHPAELRQTAFPAGSMGPKVEAACRFVEAGGRFSAIGRMEDAAAILAGHAGTLVRRASRAAAE